MSKPISNFKPISNRQKQILSYIQQHMDAHGYPPTVREIGSAVSLSSSSTVHAHLKTLQEHGHIERDAVLTRAIKLTPHNSGEGRPMSKSVVQVPIIGTVAAGMERDRRTGLRADQSGQRRDCRRHDRKRSDCQALLQREAANPLAACQQAHEADVLR